MDSGCFGLIRIVQQEKAEITRNKPNQAETSRINLKQPQICVLDGFGLFRLDSCCFGLIRVDSAEDFRFRGKKTKQSRIKPESNNKFY